MSGSAGIALPLLAGLAGLFTAAAARELVAQSPRLAAVARRAVEPLERAGREGRVPTRAEARRLAIAGTVALLAAGLLLLGPGPAPLVAVGGPGLAGWAVARRRARYRQAVEERIPDMARLVADGLAAGGSVRGALQELPGSLEGPAGVEAARLAAELEVGEPTEGAVDGMVKRLRSERIDAFAATLLSQREAGGDLAGLLRRHAVAEAERARAAQDARSATAQARFTGVLVVALPAGGALFAELMQPGFVGSVAGDPLGLTLLSMALALQVAGFAAVHRLARVEP